MRCPNSPGRKQNLTRHSTLPAVKPQPWRWLRLRMLEASDQTSRALHVILERDGELVPGHSRLQGLGRPISVMEHATGHTGPLITTSAIASDISSVGGIRCPVAGPSDSRVT